MKNQLLSSVLLAGLLLGLTIQPALASSGDVYLNCISRINSHVQQDHPDYNPTQPATGGKIDPYLQQDITAFCLDLNNNPKTYVGVDYPSLDTAHQINWDFFDDYAATAFYEKETLSSEMSPVVSSTSVTASLQQKLSDDLSKAADLLYNLKLKAPDLLNPAIQSCSDPSSCLEKAESDLIEKQYNDFKTFIDAALAPLAKNYLCDAYTPAQCSCFEGFQWDTTHATCTAVTPPPATPLPPATEPTPVIPAITVQQFPDVPSTSLFFSAINYLKINSIVSGYADGNYKPAYNINRAEFTKIIIGAIKSSLPTGTDAANCFKDVSSDWYSPYVCSAKTQGIVTGYPDGNFHPDANINLAEALKIILLAKKVSLSSNAGSRWYSIYLNTAQENNLFYNVTNDPAHLLTRGEMAQLIYLLDHKNS